MLFMVKKQEQHQMEEKLKYHLLQELIQCMVETVQVQ